MYDFLLVTNSNFGHICYRFRDRRLKLKKIAEFFRQTLCEAPVRGNPLEFGDEIWRRKTRVLGLTDGEEIMPLAFLRFDTIPARDGETDRQTRCDRYYPR